MTNPNGPATQEARLTQGLNQRKRRDAASRMTPDQKRLKRLLHGQSSSKVKKAFDLGLRSTNLSFLAAHLWAEIVRIDELVDDGSITEQSAVTTKSKLFDLLRRIHDKLDTGPMIPDEITLSVETVPGLSMESDRPETSE